jgi:hypothetical protein
MQPETQHELETTNFYTDALRAELNGQRHTQESTDSAGDDGSEQLVEYRDLQKQAKGLRAEQHSCEINLQKSEYLKPEQKDATLARYGDVTRDLTAVTKRLTELERDPQVRATLEREEHAKNAYAREFSSGAGVNESEPQPWPEPEPLRREIPPGDPYPLEALGDVLTGAAQVLRMVIQAPDAICAQSLLAGAALAVQGHADVEIDGRDFPLSEYFLSVAKTGERKTATDKAALAPHTKRQHDLQQHYAGQIADYEADLAAWQKARDEALSSKKNESREAKKAALLALGPEPQAPLNVILTTEEPTYEGVVKAFVSGWPSTGLFSDEGGRFIGGYGMDPKNQLKTIAGLSKLWDGSPITRTRGGDGNLLLYGRRFCLHLMMQPEVSDLLFGNALLTAQGILSRCLVAQPESKIGYQPYQEADVYQQAAMKRYFARLLDILEAPLPLVEGTRNELAPRRIALAPDAKRLWIQFHDHLQTLMRPEHPLAAIQGLAAKAAEHAARLAGILTLVENLEAGVINKVHIEAGIDLVQFYLNEALRLFNSSAINPDLLLAEKLLAWARTRGRPLYLRAVYREGPNAIRDKATAHRIVSILENHGWIRRIQGGAEIDGAHHKEAWEVHP